MSTSNLSYIELGTFSDSYFEYPLRIFDQPPNPLCNHNVVTFLLFPGDPRRLKFIQAVCLRQAPDAL